MATTETKIETAIAPISFSFLFVQSQILRLLTYLATLLLNFIISFMFFFLVLVVEVNHTNNCYN